MRMMSGRIWSEETERTRVVSPDARIRLARQLVLRCSVDRLTGEGSKTSSGSCLERHAKHTSGKQPTPLSTITHSPLLIFLSSRM